jgi:hypothetical protein
MPFAVLAAPFAQAGTVPPFSIDGVVPGADATGPDAENPDDPEGNVKELGPLNSNTTKIGVIHNDAPPTLGFTNPNGQVDLRQAWLNTAKDSDGDDWIYFAWERDASNGSGFIAYEFMGAAAPAVCDDYDPTDTAIVSGCNPWANRDAGDFMILWDQQGGSKDLYYREWIGIKPNLTLTPAVLLSANVAVAEYSPDGFFGEAAINITDVVFGGVATCLAFANIIPSTVTGNSDTADYKDTILQPGIDLANCTSDVTTTPKTGAGANIPTPFSITTAGVVEVKDSALITLTGGTAPVGGTIDFSLCKATSDTTKAECASTAVVIDNDKAVTDSDGDGVFPTTVVSSSAWVTAAGRYCWQAVFTAPADSGFLGDSDVSTGECFVVSPVTPTLSTNAGADVYLGSAVTDSATLGGTAPQPTAAVIHTSAPDPTTRTAAGGTITFKLYGPSDTACGSLVYTSGTVAVSGDDTYNSPSPQFVPTAPGDYHWVAVYSGDSPNTNGLTHNADCTDTAEDVTVMTVAPTMSTAQTWVPNDDATISATAGGDLTGTVKFELFESDDCSGTAVYTEEVDIPASAGLTETVGTSNDGTAPDGYTADASGDFSWSVSYDSTNSAQDDLPATCIEVSTLTIDNDNTD